MDFMTANAREARTRANIEAGSILYWIDELLSRLTMYPKDSNLHTQKENLLKARERVLKGMSFLEGADITLQETQYELDRILREESPYNPGVVRGSSVIFTMKSPKKDKRRDKNDF